MTKLATSYSQDDNTLTVRIPRPTTRLANAQGTVPFAITGTIESNDGFTAQVTVDIATAQIA